MRRTTRFALLLHGMVSTEIASSSESVELTHPHSTAHDQGHASRAMMLRHCAATHLQYIVDQQAHGHVVDVFAHSWHAGAEKWFTEAYGSVLRAARHEKLVWRQASQKAASQALSIGRAAELMLAWGAERGVQHELALAIRHDLIISAPVEFAQMSTGSLTVSHWCCKYKDESLRRLRHCQTPARETLETSAMQTLSQCTVRSFSKFPDAIGFRAASVTNRRTEEVNNKYFLPDWWVAGPPKLIATWSNISSRWGQYVERNEQLGIGNLWSHFIWPSHIFDFLKFPIAYSSAVCGELGRHHFRQLRAYKEDLRAGRKATQPWSGCWGAQPRYGHANEPCPIECRRERDPDAPSKKRGGRATWARRYVGAPRLSKRRATGSSSRDRDALDDDTAAMRNTLGSLVRDVAELKGQVARLRRHGASMGASERKRGNQSSTQCSVYVHDPGEKFNALAMRDPAQRWQDLDHYQHVAYWLHQGLLRYTHRTTDLDSADVVFVAHYFLTHNPKARPLDFGAPLQGWDKALRNSGPNGLFRDDPALLWRWRMRPSDFVVAPILKACDHARGWLDVARWIITEPWFGTCLYRHHYDIVAPQVVSSSAWEPPPKQTRSEETEPKRHFLLYIGKLCKPYIDPPMTLLRFSMWGHLRAHPNVTFLAVDVPFVVAPYLPPANPGAAPTCSTCSYSCKQCISLPAATAHLPLDVGTIERLNLREYRSYLGNASFCLVLRGDNEATRKFTEAILAGCIPVLIADMPAWPFDRRLDYRRFSYEFDVHAATRDPESIVRALMRAPASEVAAKRRALWRVRRHFFYHADSARSGAVRQLIRDLCTTPTVSAELGKTISQEQHVAPLPLTTVPTSYFRTGETYATSHGYPSKAKLYERRIAGQAM